MSHELFLEKLRAWAAGDANVRCLLLVGSRARAAPPDHLSDIDVQVYVVTIAPFIEDTAWLSQLGNVWLCVRDEYRDGHLEVPTRLVIFEGGVKVDFGFYPAGALSAGIASSLPHRVLVDKDSTGAVRRGERMSTTRTPLPTEGEFRRVVEEFWFEAYHVAKYLARGELWLAKARDRAAKQFLVTMIEWHEGLVLRRRTGFADSGKRDDISEKTWRALHQAFAGFDAGESWSAALATMRLFRELATETASALGFAYPADVDRNLSGLIASIRDGAREDGRDA